MEIHINKVRSVYFVGIKGVAMAALAIYCKEKGIQVTGSDVADVFPTDKELAKYKIHVRIGFDSSFTRIPDLVVYTGAHGGRENPLVKKAQSLGIPTLPHGKALGLIMQGKRQIVASGSHGKTTVSAMVATIVHSAHIDASRAVGCGGITGLGAAGHFGHNEWFVAEGDEYVTDPGHDATPRFHWLAPEILVVTNVDFDHPDVYNTLVDVQKAFVSLTHKQVGQKLTIVNMDDPASRSLLKAQNVVSFGFSPRADMQITHVSQGPQQMFFTLKLRGMPLGEFTLHVPGRHNVANACAAILACQAVGMSWENIRRGVATFTGTKRRFEKLKEKSGVIFYDDYAHHPSEIAATLEAAKSWFPDRRIIAVFQPHTYSRTKALMGDFACAFTDADTVLVTDIYASARENDTLGITGITLYNEIKKRHKNVYYAPGREDIIKTLDTLSPQQAIVLFMGAGDIYNWEKEIVKQYGHKTA